MTKELPDYPEDRRYYASVVRAFAEKLVDLADCLAGESESFHIGAVGAELFALETAIPRALQDLNNTAAAEYMASLRASRRKGQRG